VVSTYFSFRCDVVHEHSSTPSSHLSENLLSEDQVLWLEQQTLKSYQLYSNLNVQFDDPSIGLQWYIVSYRSH
ncbi:unnamed protein product, partial [Porites lobata]